ncbi:MAG: TAXI family TRAP transporter solute-binding subunit [Burkholderiales bacterium]
MSAPSTGPGTSRTAWLTVAPATLVVVALVLAFYFMEPAPPDTIVISTGTEESGYQLFAQRYQEILARDGVTVELRGSAGSQENVARLMDPEAGVDVGFFQSGSAYAANSPDLVSLGAIYYEPLWIFYRGPEISEMAGLHGKKLAIGPLDSGTNALSIQLLAINAVVLPPTELLTIGGREAADKLLSGEIGAMFLVAPPEAPLVAELVSAPGIRLLSLDRAEAYTRRFPFLNRKLLPRGVFDFISDVPPHDVTLLAPTANLLVSNELHPAMAYLLMSAATEIHSGSALFNRAREFPAPLDADFPLSEAAGRYYESGPPFLQRYLPYWAAILVDRLWITLLPVLALMVPLARIAPQVYRWRIRSRIYRRYAQLKEVELELDTEPAADKLKELLERLDKIEDVVNHIHTPLAYTENLYMFRVHINLVRDKVERALRYSA